MCEVLGCGGASARSKVGVVNTVLKPQVMYRLRHRSVSERVVRGLHAPVLAMVRKALGVNSKFSGELMTGGVEYRKVGLDDWWDELMVEKVLMMLKMATDGRWGLAGEVMGMWVLRMKEAAGVRDGLLCGDVGLDEAHRDLWLGEVVEWMKVMGVSLVQGCSMAHKGGRPRTKPRTSGTS